MSSSGACRSFDCRTFYSSLPALIDRMAADGAKTIRFSPATQAIIDAGKARSETAAEEIYASLLYVQGDFGDAAMAGGAHCPQAAEAPRFAH